MLNLRLHKRSLFAGVVALAFMLVAAPVSALTITKTANPKTVIGPTGAVAYTVTVSDCEDTVVGCIIVGVTDSSTCPAGVAGCTTGPVTECPPALIGGLAGPDTYTCTYTVTYAASAPGLITNQATASGFIGAGVSFAISDTETVSISPGPAQQQTTGQSVITGGDVRLPRVSVPDADRLVRQTTRTVKFDRIHRQLTREADVDRIVRDVEDQTPDTDEIEAEVRNSLR